MARFNIQSDDGSGARMELMLPGFYYLVSLPVDVPALDKKAGLNLIKVCRGLPGTAYTVTETELVMDGRSYPISGKAGLPPKRLTVIEQRRIDAKNTVVLVKCDSEEFLILLGSTNLLLQTYPAKVPAHD